MELLDGVLVDVLVIVEDVKLKNVVVEGGVLVLLMVVIVLVVFVVILVLI